VTKVAPGRGEKRIIVTSLAHESVVVRCPTTHVDQLDGRSRTRSLDPEDNGRVSTPRITLITRSGCHLCDDARAVVAAVGAELGVAWEELSVDDDPQLRERYGEQIPVTLVDGAQHDFWRVSGQRLRAALTAGTNPPV